MKIKKTLQFLLLLIIIATLIMTMSACFELETYDNTKSGSYSVEKSIDVSYNISNNTSTVIVYLKFYNQGSASLQGVTIDCVFLDDHDAQLDRKKEAFTLNLTGYNSARCSFTFDNVDGKPTKVSILKLSSEYGLTEQEQHDIKVELIKKWIWIPIVYVILGIVVGFLCGAYTCAEFNIADTEMWLSILCGMFWPIGGIILLVVFLKEEDILPEKPPISIKYSYTVDGKKKTIKAKGFSYNETYNKLSRDDLLLICKEEGIDDCEGLNKSEIIDCIMEHVGQNDETDFYDDYDDYYDAYQDFTVAELKEECKIRGLSGYSSLRKDDLIRLILEDDGITVDEEETENTESTVNDIKSVSINKTIPKVTMDDIAGLHEAKEAFNDRVILPIKHREIFKKYNKNVGGGILLYGLPGTGKTMFAQAVANELNAQFFSIKCSDIMSKWYGESENKIKQLFKKAKRAPLAVIFFDEFEAIGRKRTTGDLANGVAIVPEILAQMQGVEKKDNNILLVLAATNCPWEIDGALLRPGRFNDKIYIPLPDTEARLFIINKILKGINISEEVSLIDVAESLEGYNSADVVEFCEQIKMLAIKAEIANESTQITSENIATVKGKVQSSILPSDAEKMELFRKRN